MIDLKMDWGDDHYPMGSPSEKEYPCFTVERSEPLDIPEAGTMTVKYRKVRSSESEDLRQGTEHYSCVLEVLSIESVKGDAMEAPARSYNDAEDALDKLAEKMMKEKKK